MSNRKNQSTKTTNGASKTNTRARGYDLLKIVQTGHVTFVDVRKVESNDAANVIIGVRSAVGYRYDKDYDDHNEVTIFWSRYFKDADAAVKFADSIPDGKYVTVIGTRQDYNEKNKDGSWEKKFENYIVEEIKWGFDFPRGE